MVEQKLHFMINPKLLVTKILKWILQKRTKKERVLEKDKSKYALLISNNSGKLLPFALSRASHPTS